MSSDKWHQITIYNSIIWRERQGRLYMMTYATFLCFLFCFLVVFFSKIDLNIWRSRIRINGFLLYMSNREMLHWAEVIKNCPYFLLFLGNIFEFSLKFTILYKIWARVTTENDYYHPVACWANWSIS